MMAAKSIVNSQLAGEGSSDEMRGWDCENWNVSTTTDRGILNDLQVQIFANFLTAAL